MNVFGLQSHRERGLRLERNCSCWASGLLPSWLPSGETQQWDSWNARWEVDLWWYSLWTYISFPRQPFMFAWSWAVTKHLLWLLSSFWQLLKPALCTTSRQQKLLMVVPSLKHSWCASFHRLTFVCFRWQMTQILTERLNGLDLQAWQIPKAITHISTSIFKPKVLAADSVCRNCRR